MTQSAIATEVHEPFDIGRDLTLQIAFDPEIAVDDVADLRNFSFRERICAGINIHPSLAKDILG